MARSSRTPALDAFRAGHPVTPIGYIRGRAIMPIAGGASDDPTPEEKAAEEAAAAKAAEDAKNAGPKEGEPGYFPAATPRADMTPAQQIAYDAFHGRKHENRAKEWAQAFPGKTAAEIKTIVDAAEATRRNTLTLDDKTLEDARADATAKALADAGLKAVRSAFNLLLGDMPKEQRDAELEMLDLGKFITTDGEVDTDKVRTAVKRIKPDKGQDGQQHQRRDYGQGSRGGSAPGGSVAAIMEQRRADREKIKK